MSRITAPATRRFHCDSCRGEIEIPFDLPATTAPCPHCGKDVSSPPPPEVFAESLAPRRAPPARESAPVIDAPAVLPSAHQDPLHKEVQGLGGSMSVKKKARHPVLVFLGAVVLVMGALVALVFLNSKETTILAPVPEEPALAPPSSASVLPAPDTSRLSREEFLEEGWKPRAAAALNGFLASRSVRDKARYVIRGPQVLDEMERFYASVEKIDESDTPADVFNFQQLDIADRRRGLFLMRFERPSAIRMSEFFRPVATLEVEHGLEEPDQLLGALASRERFSSEPVRVMGFFKEVEGDLLLDWHVYTQTKYRLFKHFINSPRADRSGVFRLIVREALPLGISGETSGGDRFFRFSDPAFAHDRITLAVSDEQPAGRILSDLAWINIPGKREQNRYATVRLRWTDEEESEIALEEIICWEFLGLGGQIGNTDKGEGHISAPIAADNDTATREESQPVSYRESEVIVESEAPKKGREAEKSGLPDEEKVQKDSTEQP